MARPGSIWQQLTSNLGTSLSAGVFFPALGSIESPAYVKTRRETESGTDALHSHVLEVRPSFPLRTRPHYARTAVGAIELKVVVDLTAQLKR